jgi:hypothetical protein
MWTGLIRLPFVRPNMSDEARDGEGLEDAEGAEDTEGVEDAEEAADRKATAAAYYEAIDAQNYDQFADLLAPGVVHERPDRTIESRATLVEFMREGRPNTDTSHEIRGVFDGGGRTDERDETVAVEGRLLDGDGETMFRFVDVFAFGTEQGEPRIVEIRTHTR